LQVIVDFIKKMSHRNFKSEHSFILQEESNVTPFNGGFEQLTAGWVAELSFQVFNGASCYTSFRKYYDIVWQISKFPGVTAEFLVDEEFGNLRSLINVGDVVYISKDGAEELALVVNAISFVSPNTKLTFLGDYAATYNKLRLKN